MLEKKIRFKQIMKEEEKHILVFKIIGKSYYQGQKKDATFTLRHIVTECDVYKKCLKCNLPNMFYISDECARKARKC